MARVATVVKWRTSYKFLGQLASHCLFHTTTFQHSSAAQHHAEQPFKTSFIAHIQLTARQCQMARSRARRLRVSSHSINILQDPLSFAQWLKAQGSSNQSDTFKVHFFAGLSSGILSAVLLQPADLLKTRVQQNRQNTILGTIKLIASGPHPIRQFWRGTLPSTLRTGCGSAIYFSGLNALRRRAELASLRASGGTPNTGDGHSSSTLPKLSNTANLATGAVARTWAGFLMMPITVLKVRFESNLYAYNSMFSATKGIFQREGLRGFFAGFGATAVRDGPYAGLYVVFYEQSKRRLSRLASSIEEKSGGVNGGRRLSSSTSAGINFMSGVAAAGLATTVTNPFDAIKTRIQLMPERYGNTIHAARKMFVEDGARSFFDGLGIRIARKAVSSALAWTVYEELIRRAEGRWREGAEQVA
jgi:solute carrier family 25 protein 38